MSGMTEYRAACLLREMLKNCRKANRYDDPRRELKAEALEKALEKLEAETNTQEEGYEQAYTELLRLIRYDYSERDAAIYIALEAISYRIPQKPPQHDGTVCPRCGSKARYGRPYEHFCCHCGQRLKN